jgi:ubiquitin C
MQIFVRTLTGRSITLDVAPTDSILALKSSIQRRENLPADIRLTFSGTQRRILAT